MFWDLDFAEELLAATDFRQFILCFFKRHPGRNFPEPLTYQRFADLAGFASKSFMADVIAGRKQLSKVSFEQTAVALKLNPDWREYLFFLIAQERPAFCPDLSSRQIKEKSLELKIHLKQTVAKERALLASSSKNNPDGFRDLTLEDTAPPAAEVFMQALHKAHRRFPEQVNSNSSLFMTQNLLVRFHHLPILKNRLSRLIAEFANDSKVETSDTVAEICVSFTHKRNTLK